MEYQILYLAFDDYGICTPSYSGGFKTLEEATVSYKELQKTYPYRWYEIVVIVD